MIDNSLSSQKELFTSILDASKIEAGTMNVNPKDFLVKPLCNELENEFSVLAQDKGLTFKTSIDSEPVVYSDELIVKRILKNLLSNAVRYTEQGELILNVKTEKQQVFFTVIDTGPGIAIDEQEKIFNEFYQISNKQGKSKGLGLGLSIVHKLSSLLGTHIHLDSNLGKGCAFSFALPLGKEVEMVERRKNRGVLDNWALDNRSIMVIDDELDILNAMKQQLESWGSTATIFSRHFDALDYIKSEKYQPDIIIIDYRLGDEVRGTEVIGDILAVLSRPTPVIFISAEIAAETIQEIKAAGYQLLHKPVRPAVLRMALQRQLKLANQIEVMY